jgi:hypothetical protein
MNALRGTAIWGNNGYGDPPVVDADTNNDSMVSWREAYDYTKYHDSKEDPVFFGEDSFWMVEPDVPTWASNKKVRTGGALATELTNQTLVYGFKGNNTCEFFVFDPAKDSWFEREMIPHTGSTGNRKVSSGGTLASVGNGKLYATKGKCLEFWKFDDSCLAGSKWTEMPSVPAGLKSKGPKDGASAVAVSLNDTPYIYLLKANNTLEFYRFNTVTGARDTTCSLAQPPEGTEGKKFKAGSCMAFDGYDTIYAVKGTRSSTTQYFPVYAYSVRGDAWCSMPGLPLTSRKTTATGSAMAFLGNNLYVAKGKTLEMWVYRRADGNWHRMQSMPSGPSGKDRVYTGCALASDGNFIWAFKGGNSKDFYRFTPNRCPGESQSSPTPPVAGGNELLLAEDGDAEDVRWSNSGEWVAFTAPDDSGRRQVFKVAVGGGDPQQLTSLAGECARPVWSDNDSTIAFEATPDTGAYCQIATVPAVGGSMSYMTSSPQDKWHLTWSPSGMLAFLSNDSMGYAQVYTLDGLNSVVGLTQEPTEHESPEFASTMEIVYTREGDNGYAQLYVIRIDSLEETALTSSLRDHSNLAPAPGAGFVFCEVVDANGYSQIAAVPVGGGAETDLTSESYDFESPTTNSDATAIFCTQSSGPGSALCRVYPSGGWEQLTDEEVERLTPHAQPSGLTLSAAYVRDGDVYRLSEVARKSQQSAGQVPLALSVAEPNPGRDRVTIRWQVSAFCDVSLRVYNAAGQLVKVLADGRTKPGAYTSVWNGTDAKGRRLATGVYFCALEDGAQRISRKVVLTE